MGCATGVVKYLVFIFNLLFALVGLAIIVIGVLFKIGSNEDMLKSDEVSILSLSAWVLIIVGVIIFIISFFGCCGAIRESGCMLTTFAVILLGLFIIQVGIGIYMFVEIKDEDGLRKVFIDDFNDDLNVYNNKTDVREYIDEIQKINHCCGSVGPNDYSKKNLQIPPSCCINQDCNAPGEALYQDGCANKIFNYMLKNIKVMAIVALVIALTELIGAIFALCLANSLRNQYRRGAYA